MAMTHAGYLVAGYTVTFGAIAGYVTWLAVRQRAVARAVRREPSEGEPSGSSR